ncbi:MAG: hypothetical protein QOJ66_3632, partial [Ilumatobacteraceae bacterium]
AMPTSHAPTALPYRPALSKTQPPRSCQAATPRQTGADARRTPCTMQALSNESREPSFARHERVVSHRRPLQVPRQSVTDTRPSPVGDAEDLVDDSELRWPSQVTSDPIVTRQSATASASKAEKEAPHRCADLLALVGALSDASTLDELGRCDSMQPGAPCASAPGVHTAPRATAAGGLPAVLARCYKKICAGKALLFVSQEVCLAPPGGGCSRLGWRARGPAMS